MEKINRAHNADSLILLEPQKIEVARNNEVCLSSKSTGEDMVIIRVLLDDVGDGFGDNDFPCFVQKSNMQTHPLLVPGAFPFSRLRESTCCDKTPPPR